MPLQLTTDSEIVEVLIEHGATMTTDVVFKLISSVKTAGFRIIELFSLSSRKGMMLWNPTDVNRCGNTALDIDLAYILNKRAVINYLLTEAKCDPSENNLIDSLLGLSRNLNVVKLLIKQYGARATPKLVLKFEAMEDAPDKGKLLELMLIT